jgi:NADPH-dependent 2,4-dienoyl-CoA reductase/sulfur reductase-like enzyme/rhodanese-related sulfurtransferase
MTNGKRILIVGGVAGGASAAARARRLCETCEIVVFDRGPHVSFANCGLPYFVGDVITDEAKLLVATPELFRERFAIDVRTHHEVLSIDREAKELEVRDLARDTVRRERYDALVLAPGARPIRPPLPGIDLPGIFVLRTIPDSHKIREWIDTRPARRAVVVGGGFIGLEMAENLVRRGLAVTLVEAAPHVLPVIDREMAQPVEEHLRAKGVTLQVGDGVRAFEETPGGLVVHTASGAALETDLVILGIGVQPESRLAAEAGLKLGERGAIQVDASMRTSDPSIWAVGDAVEVRDVISGRPVVIPLAGPANRQGRVAADALLGREASFRGVQGTSVCGVFDLEVAATGASERLLRGQSYEKVYLHPGHHAGYYPGARPIHLKVLFAPEDGRILGAQAVGEQGAARRIDVIAMAIQMGGTIHDLEQAELCYAPQFGAAKDPVNIAGMIAGNALRGDLPLARWEDVASTEALILDVREPAEVAERAVPGAVNIPLHSLRARSHELPADRDIWVYCRVGQRAYYATRILLQRGLKARMLSGGLTTGAAYGLGGGE